MADPRGVGAKPRHRELDGGLAARSVADPAGPTVRWAQLSRRRVLPGVGLRRCLRRTASLDRRLFVKLFPDFFVEPGRVAAAWRACLPAGEPIGGDAPANRRGILRDRRLTAGRHRFSLKNQCRQFPPPPPGGGSARWRFAPTPTAPAADGFAALPPQRATARPQPWHPGG